LRQQGWLLALVGAVCVYNLPQLLLGTVQFDGLEVHYAAQRYLSDELHAGRLPFWTPYLFSGFPFLADLQVAAWYPPNWPFYLAGITPRSIGAELALHSLIASVGAYALARRLIGQALPALFVGMFYGLSGWFATHSQHVGMVDTAAWLPWLLLALDQLAERGPSPRRLAVACLLGALIILPGHFQLALYSFAFVAIWAALEAASPSLPTTTAARFALGLVSAACGGALLAAVMLVPAAELVSQSVRTQLNALDLPDIGYFHPAALMTLVDPDFYGLLSGHYTGPGDSTQHYFYAGLLLLPLAVLGLRNGRIVRTAAFLSLPFLWYAFGPAGGLYRLLARLPGFSSVELPMHGWFLAALGLALLGGAGVARLGDRLPRRWIVALIPILLVDLTIVNQLLNPLAYARSSFDALYGAPLRSFQDQVASAQPPVQRLYGPPLAAVAYRNHALQSRLQTTYGYNPLELAGYADYASAAEANPLLIAGFAANYQLTSTDDLEPTPTALPMAYFARSITTVPDEAFARARLGELDPARSTLMTGERPPVDPDASASVSVVSEDADALTLHYTAGSPSLLRVAIPAYPGWHAMLDGAEEPILTVDHAFTGVVVPPGEGDLRLFYEPRLFWVGALVSAMATLAVVRALVFVSKKRPSQQASPPAAPQTGSPGHSST
jgi:hypothetical protein